MWALVLYSLHKQETKRSEDITKWVKRKAHESVYNQQFRILYLNKNHSESGKLTLQAVFTFKVIGLYSVYYYYNFFFTLTSL